jgi:ferredoxin
VSTDIDHAQFMARAYQGLDEARSLLAAALENDGQHALGCKGGKRCKCWRARAQEISAHCEPWEQG